MKNKKMFFMVLFVLVTMTMFSGCMEERRNFNNKLIGTWWAEDPFVQYDFQGTNRLYIITEDGQRCTRWRYVDPDHTSPYLVAVGPTDKRKILITFSRNREMVIYDRGKDIKLKKL